MPVATNLVGRTRELAVIGDVLDLVDSGTPGVLQLVGPAGIGKSRLLAELGGRADSRGHVVLTGAGAELEQDLPFWVFVDALDEYVDALEPRRLERLEEVVRDELAQILPSLARPGAVAATGAGVHERHRTHRAMRVLLETLAATKPLVILLDDFHWADPASTDLLVALLHRPPAAGVLLALAARPRQLPVRLASALDRAHRSGTLTRLELDPLTAEEALELVGTEAAELYEEAGGNPFYLEQLARVSRQQAAPRPRDVLLGGVEVPPMVAAALAEDLTLLNTPTRRALDAAAVAGDPFEVDIAAAAADLAERELLDALDELMRVDFVRTTDVPRRFRFRHPIVRRAVYEATPGGWRIGAHARVSELLAARGAPATARAHHVERSAAHGDEAAISVLRAAGDESMLRAPATAARWYEAALRLLPATASATERVELLLPAAQGLMVTGQFSRAHEALLESLRIAPSERRDLRTQLAAYCARVEHLLGHHHQAHRRLVSALDELDDEDSPESVTLRIELSMDGVHRMDYASMVQWVEPLLHVAGVIADRAVRAAALAAAARAAAVPGATGDALVLCDQAARAVDELTDDELARRLDATTMLAGAELYLHRFERAVAHGERALRVGRATGQGQQFPLIYALLGTGWYMRGMLREAAEPLEGAVEAARLTGNAQTLGWSLYARSRIALALGDVNLALTAAQEAVDVTDDGTPSHHHSHAAVALADASLEIGKPERAISLLETAHGGRDMPLAAKSFRSFFLDSLVRARLALSDVDGAAASAAVARDSADEVSLPLAGAFADRVAAEVALRTGDAARAADLALRSAATAADAGAPMEASLSHVVAGRALAATGETEHARKALQAAADDFQSRGAIRHRDRAERELRALGVRIHRQIAASSSKADSGVAALTKRELEIARLIVDRRTNREIAESLFLSPKTVETHVRNIFGKLGADSRVEVARIVERAERLSGSGAEAPT